jgi:hypothetical protein
MTGASWWKGAQTYVMDKYPGVVRGAFLWGEMMSSNEEYARTFGLLRGFGVRGKLVEEVVRMRYATWRSESVM